MVRLTVMTATSLAVLTATIAACAADAARPSIRDRYAALDANHDGQVSVDEYVVPHRKGPFVDVAEEETRQADADQNGQLSLVEFALTPQGGRFHEALLEVLDQNQDGKLSRDEYVKPRPKDFRWIGAAEFYRRDRNVDGLLDGDELRADEVTGVPDAHLADCQQRIDAFLADWKTWDKDGDEAFSVVEWPIDVARKRLGECANLPFPEWDRDRDGRMTQGELRRLVEASFGCARLDGRTLRPGNGRVLNWALVRKTDLDADEVIDREEYLKALPEAGRGAELFKQFDQDNSGTLTESELLASRRFDVDVIAEFFRLDGDLDGKLTAKELLDRCSERQAPLASFLVPPFDDDHDRALSLDEFWKTPLANPVIDWFEPRKQANGDNRLSFAEFWMERGPIGLDLTRSVFDRFDRVRDGFLTPADVVAVRPDLAVFDERAAADFLKANGLTPAEPANRVRNAPLAVAAPVVMQFEALQTNTRTGPPELSASLNTNEELERFLERAGQVTQAGRPDLAPVLWQRVLDESLGVLANQANGTTETRSHTFRRYRPLSNEAERRIVAAGPEALRLYRLTADAEARSLLSRATPETREAVLGEVARRFFLSSVGDDALFELGCLRLERREYAAAASAFSRLNEASDASVPADQIVSRLAIALARLGSVDEALSLLREEPSIPPELAKRLEADFVSPTARPTTAIATTAGWPMTFGDATRTGLWPDVPAIDWTRPLRENWEYLPKFELQAAPEAPKSGETTTTVINGRRVQITIDNTGRVSRSRAPKDAKALTRSALIQRQQEMGWQPAGNLVFAGDRIVLRSEDRLICCTSEDGQVRWMGRKTRFPFDPEILEFQSLASMGYYIADDASKRPRTATEASLFGDRIAHEMVVAGDLALCVEGELNYGPPKAAANPNEVAMRVFNGEGGGRESRQNWLAAYDLETGKLRWHRSSGEAGAEAGAFLSAPLPLGERLAVPIGDQTHVELALLDRATGATIWRVGLCDVTTAGDTSAPLGMAAADGRLFVTTGAGAVFAVEMLTGSVEWAVTYPRRLTELAIEDEMNARMFGNRRGGASPPANSSELRENSVFCYGNTVIALATDFDYAVALDSRDGSLLWEAPLQPLRGGEPVRYCVGLRNGKMFLASARIVRRYDLESGRVDWEHPLYGSCGRGILTTAGLFLPEGNQVRRFDADTGADLGVTPVATPDSEPVGNLYSDGRRLYSVSAGRVTALGPVSETGDGS